MLIAKPIGQTIDVKRMRVLCSFKPQTKIEVLFINHKDDDPTFRYSNIGNDMDTFYELLSIINVKHTSIIIFIDTWGIRASGALSVCDNIGYICDAYNQNPSHEIKKNLFGENGIKHLIDNVFDPTILWLIQSNIDYVASIMMMDLSGAIYFIEKYKVILIKHSEFLIEDASIKFGKTSENQITYITPPLALPPINSPKVPTKLTIIKSCPDVPLIGS